MANLFRSPKSGEPEISDEAEQAFDTTYNILRRGKAGKWAKYNRPFVAQLTADEKDLMDNFLGGDLAALRDTLGQISQQDSLSRAQLLLDPITQRSTDAGLRRLRERSALTGNLLSTGAQESEAGLIGNILAQRDASVAGLIPALDQSRMAAVQGQQALLNQAMGLAGLRRQIEQQKLTADFQEWLRTQPAGGVLQGLLQLNSAVSGGGTVPTYGPSPFSSILGAAAPIAGGAIANENIYFGENAGEG